MPDVVDISLTAYPIPGTLSADVSPLDLVADAVVMVRQVAARSSAPIILTNRGLGDAQLMELAFDVEPQELSWTDIEVQEISDEQDP